MIWRKITEKNNNWLQSCETPWDVAVDDLMLEQFFWLFIDVPNKYMYRKSRNYIYLKYFD